MAELNLAGSTLVYSTYLGSTSNDLPHAIAVDGWGAAYVTGSTSSTNFPTTSGALQTVPGGHADAFITKLSTGGVGLAYSTYLGGSGGTTGDVGSGIDVDSLGNAYVTGYTESTDFPTTPGALQTAFGGKSDAFVAKVNALGSALVYSTYLGGSGNEDGTGSLPAGAIAVDGFGNAYVTGETRSANFPIANALQPTLNGGVDAFVTELNTTGTGLVYSTFLGGSAAGGDTGYGIAVDGTGNAFVTGQTASLDFPTKNALQGQLHLGDNKKPKDRTNTSDAFVTKIDPSPDAMNNPGSEVFLLREPSSSGSAVLAAGAADTRFGTVLILAILSGSNVDQPDPGNIGPPGTVADKSDRPSPPTLIHLADGLKAMPQSGGSAQTASVSTKAVDDVLASGDWLSDLLWGDLALSCNR